VTRLSSPRAPYDDLSPADAAVIDSPRPPNLKALTSIRFFAALYVALYHMVRPFERWGIFTGLFGAGYTAVSFFFLLSGFILTYSHAADPALLNGQPARFYIARFARIYPVYLLSVIAAGILYAPLFAKRIHILAYIADLFMMQSWSARMVAFFNIPAWSLSCEAFFYLVFPWFFLRLRPGTARRNVIGFLLLWILALLAPLTALALHPSAAGAMHENGQLLASAQLFRIRRIPLLALPEFLAGITLAWMHLRFPMRRFALVATALGTAGALTALFFADHLPFALLHNGLLLPLFALVILGLSQDHILTRALSIAPLVLLGEASYALYLSHYLFSDWIKNSFHIPEDFHGLALRLLVLIPLSIALHLWVERPGRKLILHLWAKKHPKPASPSS
jgi:peptidoglycan/LPS O-acetylase OafA/YrhL